VGVGVLVGVGVVVGVAVGVGASAPVGCADIVAAIAVFCTIASKSGDGVVLQAVSKMLINAGSRRNRLTSDLLFRDP
jgi:hypothetical protein